ncbi:MAG: hypothetical protein KDB07_10870 [Planctomycetes bacterium]|nr:hypothetical protein [Planctomycetota bacterium]
MTPERRRTSNYLRLLGYLIEVVIIGGYLIFNQLPEFDQLSVEARSTLQTTVLIGAGIGAALIAAGSYIRMKPPSAEEVLQERLRERQEG